MTGALTEMAERFPALAPECLTLELLFRWQEGKYEEAIRKYPNGVVLEEVWGGYNLSETAQQEGSFVDL